MDLNAIGRTGKELEIVEKFVQEAQYFSKKGKSEECDQPGQVTRTCGVYSKKYQEKL